MAGNAVGTVVGVAIEVAAWDAVGADVELSCAGMFASEAGASLQGGLAHLDAALTGKLVGLRREGHFTGRLGECLLVSIPSSAVRAPALLVVGLGEPEGWSSASLREAVRAAAGFALALGVRSAAFAPGMLDSGIAPESAAGAPGHMVDGLAKALESRHRLVALGLAGEPALLRWVFDVGAARLASATGEFRARVADLAR